MNLFLKRISNIFSIWRKMREIKFDNLTYITPAIMSHRLGVSQSTARIMLEVAERSNDIEKVYLVRMPFGDHRIVGTYNVRDEIPESIDPGTYEHNEFTVTEDLIEVAYRSTLKGAT